MLGLEGEAPTMNVHFPGLSRDRSIQKIPGVHLDTRLSSPNPEHASRYGIIYLGGLRELPSGLIQHPIVVVSLRVVQLSVVLIDARSNHRQLAEIERRSCNGLQNSRWNQIGIHGSKS